MSNLGGCIAADRKRLEQIKLRQQRAASADAAPNGVAFERFQSGYCRITFADKPEREILDALKAARFSWGAGSWTGKTDQLPANVAELVTAPAPEIAAPEAGIVPQPPATGARESRTGKRTGNRSARRR